MSSGSLWLASSQPQGGDCRNARQGLSSEAEGGYVGEVFGVLDLAGEGQLTFQGLRVAAQRTKLGSERRIGGIDGGGSGANSRRS